LIQNKKKKMKKLFAMNYVNYLFGHNEKCIYKQPNNHPCEKKCYLYKKSNGCNEDCSLQYEHEGKHICSVKENFHTCKEKCKLCEHEMLMLMKAIN